MKKLILFSAFIIIGFNLFAQRRVDADIVIVRDSIIMTGGKITDMNPGTANKDAVNRQQLVDSVAKYSFVQPVDSLQFNPNIPDQSLSTTKYNMIADSLTGFIAFKDDNVTFLNYLNATVEFPFVNTTGITLLKGTPVSSDVIAIIGGVRALPSVEITVNNDIGLAQTFAGVVADDTPIGEVGRVLKFTFLDDYNTSGFAVRDILYVGGDSTLTNVAPSAPNYKIVVGRTLTSDVSGLVAVTSEAFTGSDTDVNLQGILNGIITKTQAIRDTTIGGVIYFETFNENNPTEDLPYMAGQSSFLLNTTTNTGTNGYARVALTPGTSTASLTNYVYIDNTGTPTLSVSTAQFPADGIRVGELNVNDVTTHGNFGFASIQRFNNAVDGTESDGWVSKSSKRTRENGSKYESGSDATFEIITSGGLDSLKYSVTPGEAWQFNEQTINSTSRLKYKWLNSPTGEQWIDDLHDIDVDSDGNTLRSNNDIYGLNLFYIINSGDYEGYIAVNTPRDKYSTEANCINDVANFAIKTVPLKYDKVAFRHGRVVVKYSTSSGGTFTNPIGVGEFQDERGQPLGSGGSGAGSGSAVSNFSDTDFTIFSNSDPTKIVTFNATDSITTGTTREQTVQDKDGVLAHLADLIDTIFTTENIAFSSDSINYTKNGVTYNVTEIRNPDGIDQGGIVTLESGLIYNISPCKYQINGVPFETITSQETLTTADPTNPRIDIIVVDTFGVTDIVTGVAAASPQKPTADPTSQIELTSILVNAGATTGEPGGGGSESITVVYDENVEWVGGQVGTTVDFASATDPFHGTINAEVTNISNVDLITFTTPTPILATDLTNFSMYLKLKEEATKKHRLYVQLIKDSQGVSNFIQLPMDYTNTGWQNLSVPLEGIYLGQDSIDEVQLVWAITPDAVFSGFYIDLVQLQGGYDQAATIQPHSHPISDITGLNDSLTALRSDITLQNAYDGGSKIITNADSLAVKIQSGSGDDADTVLEILNGIGTVKTIIRGNGRVGIGVSEPLGHLHVQGTSDPQVYVAFDDEIVDPTPADETTTRFLSIQHGKVIAHAASTANNGLVIGMKGGSTTQGIHIQTGNSLENETFIRKDGNVGIGTTTPSEKLEVNGNVLSDAYATNVQTLTETAGAVAWDMSSGSKAKVTIDETSVITITNMPVGAEATIRIVQGDAGDDNVTFVLSGATVEWRGDDTDLTDASGAIDYISVVNMDGFLGVTLGSNYVTQ